MILYFLSLRKLNYEMLDTKYAVMAELADALDSGSSGVTPVEVRVLLTAPYI